MKRVLGIVFFVAISMISLCSCDFNRTSKIEDFSFEMIDGEITITGYNGSDLDIVVPDVIENRLVTVIGEEAFMKYDMNSIELPKTLRIVEKDAFRGCKKLKTISFPEGMTEVRGKNTFQNCNSLSEIHLPDTLMRFDDDLSNTSWYKLQPEGVLYIDNVCVGFKGNNYPDSLEIKDNTKSIIGLFKGFVSNVINNESSYGMNFKNVYIPESVIYIAPKSVGYHTEQEWSNGIVSADFPNQFFTIRGKSGTCAEKYANDNKFNFINIDYQDKDISGKYVLTNTENSYSTMDEQVAMGEITLTISNNIAVLEQEATGTKETLIVDTHSQTFKSELTEKKYSFNGSNLIVYIDGTTQMIFEKQ